MASFIGIDNGFQSGGMSREIYTAIFFVLIVQFIRQKESGKLRIGKNAQYSSAQYNAQCLPEFKLMTSNSFLRL